MRRNLNQSSVGKRICGTPATGVLGSLIPSTGDHGAGYAYNDLTLPDDASKEICGRITSWPSSGMLFAYEDTSFEFSGAPDGTYHFEYQLYVDGLAVGDPVTVTLQVGPVVHAANGTLSTLNATLAGVAHRTHEHAATGDISASAANLSSNAERAVSYAIHASSGALLASGAQIVGASARSGSPTIHATVAQIIAGNAAVVASAGRSSPGMVPIPQEQLDYLLAYMQANLAMSTPEQIAAAVLAAMQASPPPTNTVAVKGDTSIQPWPTATQNAEAVWSKELP